MALLVWIIVIHSILLFLTAAKTHGRQLRLERELHGYMDVQFGTGANPPWVEALWKRDRIRFWSLTALFVAIALAASLTTLGPRQALPLHEAVDPDDHALALGLIGSLLWAPSLTFTLLASFSLLRFRRRLRHAADTDSDAVAHTPKWRRDARNGTLVWFATLLLLAALTAALSYA